ncbi:MAG: D-glucuronyl C5-epimerase family protein [Anaerolineales bacterium]|nr:D-glucuronyl C5-epimerase family protein [Anaerolineales bacterium]
MNRLTEAIVRKAWNAAYRLKASPRDGASPIMDDLEPQIHFTERFYPYHFLTPEILARQLYFNEQKIPVRYIRDHRPYNNPVYPAYYGLVCLNHGGADDLSAARAMADFLMAESDKKDDALFWHIHTTLPQYHLQRPFPSGLAQGLCASLFVRLFHHTQSRGWLDAACAAVRGMLLPVDQGGMLRQTPERLPWVEEYPGETPSFVLNGFLFSLIALLEVESTANVLFPIRSQALLESLLSSFPLYRHGRYLFYDRLYYRFCNPQYMGLHTLLLHHLYRSTALEQVYSLACDLHRDVHWNLYMQSFGTTPSDQHRAWLHAELGS